MNSTTTGLVESLTYSHSMTNETRRFVGGFRQVIHVGDFHCEVDETKLVAKPVADRTSLEEAEGALEPYLRSWALRSELLLNVPMRFKKTGHLLRDEVGGQVVGVGVVEEVEIAEQVIAMVTTNRLTPPEDPPLAMSEEVERIADRWRDVKASNERLLVGAYWVLTELERYYGGRSDAAKRLAVSTKALNRLGELASRNDPEHGRKANSPVRPLTHEEATWIRTFVPKLILRVAEVESGLNDLPQITMAVLPALSR